MQAVTLERKLELSQGRVEASNLMEVLAVDYRELMANCAPQITLENDIFNLPITKKLPAIADQIIKQEGEKNFGQYSIHQSDAMRSICCYVIGHRKDSVRDKFVAIEPFANDPNPMVREWAWLALRSDFSLALQESIDFLVSWSNSEKRNLRRFASEISRPRGVWCKWNEELRKNPQRAFSILQPLKADSERYVQLSVGNWLNDAGKDNPDWVINICNTWSAESASSQYEKFTQKIIKRAQRNLKE